MYQGYYAMEKLSPIDQLTRSRGSGTYVEYNVLWVCKSMFAQNSISIPLAVLRKRKLNVLPERRCKLAGLSKIY